MQSDQFQTQEVDIMNAEDKGRKLLQCVPNANLNTRGVISDWINGAMDVVNDLVETVDALRELNHNQFQEIGRLQKSLLETKKRTK